MGCSSLVVEIYGSVLKVYKCMKVCAVLAVGVFITFKGIYIGLINVDHEFHS